MSSVLSFLKEILRKQSGNALLKIETALGIPEIFVCQFNPDEFHISTSGDYRKVKRQGGDSPIVQFAGNSSQVLDLKLYFDTSTSYEIKAGGKQEKPRKEKAKDVSAYTRKLMSLVQVNGKLHRPAVVTFCWGSVRFSGFVEKVDTRYLMFENGGMPVRAEVSLNIISRDMSLGDEGKLNPRESPDRTKCIVLSLDSSLWDIAEKEYGDASYWREIARANNIMNPLEVPVGTQLKVPALHL